MNSYVTRFTLPDDPCAIREQLSWESETDLETLLRSVPVRWSLPKSVMIGDVIWFQLSKRSQRTFRDALKVAHDLEMADVVAHLDSIRGLIASLAGHVVAVGRVTGAPSVGEGSSGHSKARVFADVDGISVLEHPMKAVGSAEICSLPAFSPHGPVVNRVFGSDEEYRSFLASAEAFGNTLPVWTKRRITGPVRMKPLEHWLEDVALPELGFLSEAQLAACWGTPLLREISDRRFVEHEVQIKSEIGAGRVDAVVFLDSVPLPVEFKLNAGVEGALAEQVRKYAGPARLSLRSRTALTGHPYVLVIDRHGGELWHGLRAQPARETKLDRCAVSIEAIEEWREAVASKIEPQRSNRDNASR